MKKTSNLNKKLLVEGTDDLHVIKALCTQYNIQETFDVVDCKGIDNLIEQIPLRFKESGTNTIGIIVDADIDLNARWQSIKNILTDRGFVIPYKLPEKGLIVENGIQKVGVWIMPNNNSHGMLEDFISFLVPENDKLMPIVHLALNDLETKQLNRYSNPHKSKAMIHTWLAWQENPGTPMGLSITKRYLTTDGVTCQFLVNWLVELFKE